MNKIVSMVVDDIKDSVIGIYGAGGFAREIMPLARILVDSVGHDKSNIPLVFIDDNKQVDEVNGYEVVTFDEYLAIDRKQHYFNIGVGDSKARQQLAKKCSNRGALPLPLIAPNATSYDVNLIGSGAVICANAILTSNATIGDFFQANIYSYVAHDCVIGDFVTFAPRVSCNGNVHIHDHAYIGTGAVLRQGSSEKPLVIGEGAVVGMGAVVTKDVEPFTTVVGNPAKQFQRKL